MKLVYQYMAVFSNFSLTSNHLHPLQVENRGSNSRLVVDEDDYGQFRLRYGLHVHHIEYWKNIYGVALSKPFKRETQIQVNNLFDEKWKFWVKITYVCFIWNQIFANLDLYVHISFIEHQFNLLIMPD